MFETGFTKGPCSATISLHTCSGLALVPSISAIHVVFAQNIFCFICSLCTASIWNVGMNIEGHDTVKVELWQHSAHVISSVGITGHTVCIISLLHSKWSW